MIKYHLIVTFDSSDGRVYYHDFCVEAVNKNEAIEESLECIRRFCIQNEWQLASCTILEVQDRRN